jgi:hypothetical protein
VYHAGDERAGVRGADRHGVPREAVEEVGGAVERVDDEGERVAERGGRVVRLLADEHGVGVGGEEGGPEDLLGAAVHQTHEIGRAPCAPRSARRGGTRGRR